METLDLVSSRWWCWWWWSRLKEALSVSVMSDCWINARKIHKVINLHYHLYSPLSSPSAKFCCFSASQYCDILTAPSLLRARSSIFSVFAYCWAFSSSSSSSLFAQRCHATWTRQASPKVQHQNPLRHQVSFCFHLRASPFVVEVLRFSKALQREVFYSKLCGLYTLDTIKRTNFTEHRTTTIRD